MNLDFLADERVKQNIFRRVSPVNWEIDNIDTIYQSENINGKVPDTIFLVKPKLNIWGKSFQIVVYYLETIEDAVEVITTLKDSIEIDKEGLTIKPVFLIEYTNPYYPKIQQMLKDVFEFSGFPIIKVEDII